MWSPDSGGSGSSGVGPPAKQSNQELEDLKDQFEQQQVLISQLKEMLRKSEQTKVSEERVEELASTLTKMNARAKRKIKSRRQSDAKIVEDPENKRHIDTPAKEKINLLRQQLEENKAKLAERGKSQKGIEEMVIQLKAQLDDSQNLFNQSPLNLSLTDPKIDAYSPETSSQELYRILLIKEKRITELFSKVQKLEGTVLDLQENIKEKEQVIDARTKAITLMSENLSKKGKHTLDMLDETKEQMRKMQENFVQLESEMKRDKQQLLKEVDEKSHEIEELKATNSVLLAEKARLPEHYTLEIKELNEKIAEMEKSKQKTTINEMEDGNMKRVLDTTIEENAQYVRKITELENIVEELNKQILNLKGTSKQPDVDIKEKEEIIKLKKQIEESNKNMIKVKAQHKSKIRELTKKIEAFKAISDSSAEIVRLSNENSKLKKEMEELQQERNTAQSVSKREEYSHPLVRYEDLEEEIKRLSEKLTEKEKQIEELKLKADVSSADPVTSVIDSITFEEQLDKMKADKEIILQEKEDAIEENKRLLEKLEQMMREKHEISLKLEHYMQENMDLIDKLEKMSAEKVSSAESIEIVEGLTQQEKLELEAYQKNMEFIKGSQENLEQNVELNESVNQLTEETSELLQKIELFTVERREVMEKMETLVQENIQLNSKLKEIENSRDVLIETYEQLQNEKEVLNRKLQNLEDDHTILNDKYKVLQEENEVLRSSVVASNKNTYNSSVLEKEKDDLQNRIIELGAQLEGKETEILNLNSIINDLNGAMNNLENENKGMANRIETVENLEKQLDELKQLFNENIQQAQCYENEIADNTKQLNQLRESLHQMELDLRNKDDEIKQLSRDKANLQDELNTKNENFVVTIEELKGKYEKMVAQIDQNSDCFENIKKPLEEKIDDLMNKNKEQLEKMKKIAANLKRKSTAYQELEKKYDEMNEKWEHENREKEYFREAVEKKDVQILEMNQKINSLVQQLNEMEDVLSAAQNQLFEKETQYNSLLEEFNTFKERSEIKLQEELRQYEKQIATFVHENEILRSQLDDILNSKSHHEEIKQLNEELEQLKYNSTTHSNALQAKIQELEMFIENQDAELTIYKQRVSKLEDCLNTVEERRMFLEERTLELDAQLQDKTNSIEEISNTEDELERRLNNLIARDDAIQKQFRITMEKNQELTEQNRLLNEHIDELKHKIIVAHNKVTELTANTEKLLQTEHENLTLKERICELENHLKRVQTELNQNKRELDTNESDAQEQINILIEENRDFLKQIEKLSDRLKESECQEIRLKDQITEYERKLSELKENIEYIENENRQNMEQCSIKSIQEDYVVKLKQIIAEKEKEIEEYQKQNLQLQMQSSFGPDDVSNDTKVQLRDALNKIVELQEIIEKYTTELTEKRTQITTLSNQLKHFRENPETEPPQIATFSWPQEAQMVVPSQQQNDSESNAEELQKKVKALEFMLYNVEKEKDEVVMQCHQLSNELTRLVYEREQVPTDVVGDQILSNVDLSDTPETIMKLHNIEYEPTKPIRSEEVLVNDNQEPVTEEILTPKTAYLCYGDDEKQVISQIVKKENLIDTIESQKRLQEMEFEKVKPIVKANSTKPIDEDKIQANVAYLCYDDNKSEHVAFGGVGENDDDGWVWGPEEVKLEEEHRHQSDNVLNQNIFATEMKQLTEKIKVLEMEREHHLEEIRQAQIKSGKLIKKLKELKSKNDQLSCQIAVQSSNLPCLDDTIQDEFKLQIENFEKNIKQLTADLAKERLEKENLKKRIDVLTAANDRMIEIKEKQEIEILSWQQRNRELENKLAQFNWGHDDFEPSPKHIENEGNKNSKTVSDENIEQLQKRIEELNETIKELSLDNEELQTLLEEQRNLRINAEKSKYATTERLSENTSLEQQLCIVVEEKKKLQEELNIFIQKTDVLTSEFERLSRVKEKLETLASEKNELEKRFDNVKFQYDSLIRESVELNHEVLDKFYLVEEENNRLKHFMTELSKVSEEKASLNTELEQKVIEIDQLNDSFNKQISLLRAELEERDEHIRQLESENERLTTFINEKESELSQINEKNKRDSAEYEMKLSKTIDDLQREWMQQVDQRGDDVAESWKLHLETRENEFMRLEQQLRKDIYVLEEKCNSLVNENNELRKNVDAEIKNEVDRMAALQQQINDKQNEINELNKSLQEKGSVIETIQSQLALALQSVAELREQVQNNELKITDYETTLAIKNEELVRTEQWINNLKDTEIRANELHKLLEESEIKLRASQNELQEKQTALTQSTIIIDDYKSKFEQLQQEFDNKNALIAELNQKLDQMQANSNNITDLQRQIDNLTGSLQEKQNNLALLSNDLQYHKQLVETHESTINRLNAYIEEVKQQSIQEFAAKSTELEQILNEKLQEIDILNKKLAETTDDYNHILSNREAQLKSLQIQLEEQVKCYNGENQKLQEKNSEFNQLMSKFAEQEKQTTDLHNIIEDQVLKIEQLRKELFEKSNDYDALVAELDMHQQKRHNDGEKYQAPSVYHETEEDNLLEPVSRAELDLALYMLHQRDVRCEELTVELMQLLEERDTLQLRLSNAIREKEQLKHITEPSTSSTSSAVTGTIPKSKTSDSVLRATRTELATEAGENLSQLDSLAHKLSELKTVGYYKDKTLVDEKKLRQLQELSIMQQHKDIAAKLPPEAAAKLVDANYTLSRDVQSPSKVLLNWLWGRSTPKVNDI